MWCSLFFIEDMSSTKYLIVGLGNIGSEYVNTRHNIGFMVLDRFMKEREGNFETARHAGVCYTKFSGRSLVLVKPTTLMNLSGKAVSYWLGKEKIPLENFLVIVDDLALPLGKLRLRKGGGDGGHNGLANITTCLGTDRFQRLRFGIGNDFTRGHQVDYVLGEWSNSEMSIIEPQMETATKIIQSFVTIGMERTMNEYNKK